MAKLATDVLREIKLGANPIKAKSLSRYFKTGKGEYGEGDVFVGLMVPEARKIAVHFGELSLPEVKKLLTLNIHEARLIALLILIYQFQKGDAVLQKRIFDFCLANTRTINNWDLVDHSAPPIIGEYLFTRNRAILFKLARSKNIWERRIAIVATSAFIARGECHDTFGIAEILMKDSHDLIHKATGWMLREVGKRCGEKVLAAFLEKYASVMPRTMLRYSIEHFSKEKRAYFLKR